MTRTKADQYREALRKITNAYVAAKQSGEPFPSVIGDALDEYGFLDDICPECAATMNDDGICPACGYDCSITAYAEESL